MFKNRETGYWEDDFRRRGVSRLHLSYGVTRKDDARELHAVMVRLFREKRHALIERVRAGDVSVHELKRRVDAGETLERPEDDAPPAVEPWPSLAVAAAQYLAWLEANPRKAKGTHGAARTELRRFLAAAGGEMPLDAVTSSRVTAFQAQLYAAGHPPNTVTATVTRVGALFNWHRRHEEKRAREEKRAPRTLYVPLDRDEIVIARTRRDRFLAPPEADALLAACPPRLLFPVMAGLLAGLRVEEMLHLRPSFDVDLTAGLLTIQEQPTWYPKNRKRRHIPISPDLRPVLEHHLQRYASADWVTPGVRRPDRPFSHDTFDDAFGAIVRRAGLIAGRRDPSGVVFHTLRHTFASWLVQRGVDLYTVSQILGNSLAVVESTYAHLAPDFRQRAVDKLAGVLTAPVLLAATENATTEASA